MTPAEAHSEEVSCSVIRDGVTAWICQVTWPNGRVVTREVGAFFVAGMPEVVITSEEQALECLVAWVQAKPREWEPQ